MRAFETLTLTMEVRIDAAGNVIGMVWEDRGVFAMAIGSDFQRHRLRCLAGSREVAWAEVDGYHEERVLLNQTNQKDTP